MSYPEFNPDQLRKLQQASEQLRRVIDNDSMRQLVESAQRAQLAIQQSSNLQRFVQWSQENREVLLTVSRQLEQMQRASAVPQIPEVRGWSVNLEAFQAATAAIGPRAPQGDNAATLQLRVEAAPTLEEAEDAVDSEFAAMNPQEAVALAGLISAVTGALLEVLSQVGHDTKMPAVLIDFISALLLLLAHLESPDR